MRSFDPFRLVNRTSGFQTEGCERLAGGGGRARNI